MTPSKSKKSAGQRRYEESNPWSRQPQYNGQFFWENQMPAQQAVWEKAAQEAVEAQRTLRTAQFSSAKPVSSSPATVTPEQQRAVNAVIQRKPR